MYVEQMFKINAIWIKMRENIHFFQSNVITICFWLPQRIHFLFLVHAIKFSSFYAHERIISSILGKERERSQMNKNINQKLFEDSKW